MYELIYDLLGAHDLFEVRNILIDIEDALAKQETNRTKFCKQLSAAIHEWIAIRRLDQFHDMKQPLYFIHPQSESIPNYLATRGLALGRDRDVRKNILDLLTYINDMIIEPTGNALSVEDEVSILSVLSEKFPYWEIVSKKGTVTILNINNSNREFNSVCGVDDNATSFVIYMYNMKDNDMAPGYVFLHELGHILQIALTNSCEIVPDEFIQFNKSLNVANELKQGEIGTTDVFADTFAIAVMHDTNLSKMNPFPFSNDLNELFSAFYKNLLDKKRNEYLFCT